MLGFPACWNPVKWGKVEKLPGNLEGKKKRPPARRGLVKAGWERAQRLARLTSRFIRHIRGTEKKKELPLRIKGRNWLKGAN